MSGAARMYLYASSLAIFSTDSLSRCSSKIRLVSWAVHEAKHLP